MVSAPVMAFPVTPSDFCSQFYLTLGLSPAQGLRFPSCQCYSPPDRQIHFVPLLYGGAFQDRPTLTFLCFVAIKSAFCCHYFSKACSFFSPDESCSVGKPLGEFILFLNFLREEGPNKWNIHQHNYHGIYQTLLENGRRLLRSSG